MKKERYFNIQISFSYDNYKTIGTKVFRVKAMLQEQARIKAELECKRLFPTSLLVSQSNSRKKEVYSFRSV